MPTLRQHLRSLSWIAFFAVFGLVFAPSISRAMAAPSGETLWSEVCTPEGTRVISFLADHAAPAEAPVSGSPLLHLDHCPLCGLSAAAWAPAPPLAQVAHPVASAERVPHLFLHAHHPMFAWKSAQPRGPPAGA